MAVFCGYEKKPSLSTEVSRFLEMNYEKPLTLDEIAEGFKTDRFALCRLFKKETGESVMERLKKIRISKAKKFLQYSSHSVETVGVLCGYETPSYFGKVFREETGVSPGEFRRR